MRLETLDQATDPWRLAADGPGDGTPPGPLAGRPGLPSTRTMTDQLSLPLDATADRLPDLPELRPMLARPLSEPFDSDQHLFEPWWGGTRALVFDRTGRAAG